MILFVRDRVWCVRVCVLFMHCNVLYSVFWFWYSLTIPLAAFFSFCFFSAFCTKFQSNELNSKISHRNRYMKRTKICADPSHFCTHNERSRDKGCVWVCVWYKIVEKHCDECKGMRKKSAYVFVGIMVDVVRCVSCRWETIMIVMAMAFVSASVCVWERERGSKSHGNIECARVGH